MSALFWISFWVIFFTYLVLDLLEDEDKLLEIIVCNSLYQAVLWGGITVWFYWVARLYIYG